MSKKEKQPEPRVINAQPLIDALKAQRNDAMNNNAALIARVTELNATIQDIQGQLDAANKLIEEYRKADGKSSEKVQ